MFVSVLEFLMAANLALAHVSEASSPEDAPSGFLETLSLVERLHRLLLDVVKDEFERVGRFDINPVQALLLFNIGSRTVSAGELKNRGYYQGSNVSYNLKKLVELGYIDHKRCDQDRRSVRVRLTERGMEIHALLSRLFDRHRADLESSKWLAAGGIDHLNAYLRKMERYWTDEIRYIY